MTVFRQGNKKIPNRRVLAILVSLLFKVSHVLKSDSFSEVIVTVDKIMISPKYTALYLLLL